MLAAVAGLAPLEVEPGRVLVGVGYDVRPVVDAGGLRIGVPALDLLAAGGDLRLAAGAVAADQVDRRAGAVARHQVAAVARVLGGRHNRTGHPQPLPAKAVKDRLQHRHNLMLHQDAEQPVQILEIVRVELVEVAVGQVLEAYVEALIGGAVARAARVHVRLDAHQQRGVEAFGLAVGGIDAALLGRGAPGQPPGGVAHQHGRPAVGVHQLAPAGRHAPEAVPVEAIRGVGPAAEATKPALAGETGILVGTEAAPRPAPLSRGEAKRIFQVRPPSQNAGRRSVAPLSWVKSAHTSTSV